MQLWESLVPARLGAGYRWLLGSSWATNVGDGIALAAGPLLIAAQTTDPVPVALAALLQRLPWLLFGLFAGVLADRMDRRLLVVAANAARVLVLAVLIAAIGTGSVGVALVLAVMFLLGTAETVVDTTATTLPPMLVPAPDLGIGNARILAGVIVGNQLVGPPIGAALFAAGMVWPFVAQAVLVALGAVLVSRIALPTRPARPTSPAGSDASAPRIGADVAAGGRWLASHPPVRTPALTIVTFNVTYGAAWSVLVLYATQRLGLGEIRFGLLTTAGAVGGLIGTALYDRLERLLSLATIMRPAW